ncbi:MAG: type II toxin-antitoxin system VapC family toxin [Desulfamplus sp.]|nr:type II toxin-antitoxin system VapC family toxin [Desulfamplus sp.]
MISLDTNILVRLLIEDDLEQTKSVQETMLLAEKHKMKIIILSEVLIETVWVLESAYNCSRDEISMYLENILSVNIFIFPDFFVILNAVEQYKLKGDFADLIIIGQSKSNKAERLITFDKKLQKRFPDYAVEQFTKLEFF